MNRFAGGGGGSNRGGRGEYYKNKYGKGRGRGVNQNNRTNGSSSFNEVTSLGVSGPIAFNNDYNGIQPCISQQLFLQRLRDLDGCNYSAYKRLENSTITYGGDDDDDKKYFTLHVGDKVQADPFAPPTKFQMIIPSTVIQLPQDLGILNHPVCRVAASDFLHRLLYQHLYYQNNSITTNSGSGSMSPAPVILATPISQYILEQTATYVTSTGDVISQFMIPLPARGRTITASAALHIFGTILPSMVTALLSYPKDQLQHHIQCVQDQHWLRCQLPSHNLVAFLANGSILPRASGVDESPKSNKPTSTTTTPNGNATNAHYRNDDDGNNNNNDDDDNVAVPFQSPTSLTYTFHLPHTNQTITGMGIPRGITLIVGGGYHGKSTVLHALQVGMYNKVPGDGREYVVCINETVKIRAEDKRSISSVDISTFIQNEHLPLSSQKRKHNSTSFTTTCFSTKEASGSTSQAAVIMEVSLFIEFSCTDRFFFHFIGIQFLCSKPLHLFFLPPFHFQALEMGAQTLLLDEDTCATNFMIRDAKMAQLIPYNKEPITPLLYKIRSLFEDLHVSTILVMGGSGDYFSVADLVLWMDSYVCKDVTAKAKEVYNTATTTTTTPFNPCINLNSNQKISKTIPHRYLNLSNIHPEGKVSVRSKGMVQFGNTELDLGGLEQIVGIAQTKAISGALQVLASAASSNGRNNSMSSLSLLRRSKTSVTLLEALKAVDDLVEREGLNVLATKKFDGELARPRIFEIGGAINRLRIETVLFQ
jgi:predicted ABC-class ATPase